MKIRKGFVSNSSSSSFIVGTEVDLNNISLDEFSEMLGDFNLEVYKGWDEENNDELLEHPSISEFAERIFNDLKHSTSTDEMLLELFKDDYYYEAKAYADKEVPHRKQEKYWDLYRNTLEDKAAELAQPSLEDWKRKHKFTYVVSYSDNDGEAHLEHQEIFRNFSYVRISQH